MGDSNVELGLPELPEVQAIQEFRPLEDWRAIVTDAVGGNFFLRGRLLRIHDMEESKVPNFSFQVTDRRGDYTSHGEDWGFLRLAAHGTGPQSDRVYDSSRRLQLLNPPWQDVFDIEREFLGLTRMANLPYVAPIRFEVPTLFRFSEETSISRNAAHIVVESIVEQADSTHIALFANTIGKTIRQLLPLSHFNQARRGKSFLYRIDVPLPEKVSMLKLRLLTFGESADALDIHSPIAAMGHPRFGALEEFGPGYTSFLKNLREAPGRHFEENVAMCFTLAGYAVLRHGGTSTEADLTVFSPNGKYCFVIECTSGPIDPNNKLGKLALRAKELQASIAWLCHPILVTQQGRALWNPSDLERAGKEGISVLGVPELEEILLMTQHGASTRDIRDFLQHGIPSPNGHGHWPYSE